MNGNGKVLEGELVESQAIVQAAPIVVRERAAVLLVPVMSLDIARQRLKEFQTFVKEYLIEDEDFGKIPGTPKPTLYKSGADKLCELYGLADNYSIITQVEDFNADPPLFDYTIKCSLTSRRDDSLVSTGLGSCNSWEGRYKYRDSQRVCPHCQKAAIIKGREDWGGGWVCWKKKEGCGAQFADGDQKIESQAGGKVLNDDIPTLKNTILKMAKKRAKVDATLAATRSSGIFTQDMEDTATQDDGSGSVKAAKAVAGRKVADYEAAHPPTGGNSIEVVCDDAGMVQLRGDSAVAALRANMPDEMKVFMVRLPNAQCWGVPNEKALLFLNFAQRQHIEFNVSNDHFKRIELASVPQQHQADESDLPANMQDVPKIESVQSRYKADPAFPKDATKGKKWLDVFYGGIKYACWDAKLFEALTSGMGHPAELIVEERGKYKNITGIKRIGNREYDELSVPVRKPNDQGAMSFT